METNEKNKVQLRNFSSILFVSDRKKSLDYYKDLGFWCDYGMGFVERQGLTMILHETNNKDKITPNYPAHGESALDIFVMVNGVEELYQEFIIKNATIHYELRTTSYNMREFAIMDLDGYSIGFGESLI
ncbi:MAG: hypothetical protein K0Q87_5227 [Neobacillus sp.]|nr:hypothetical protein [Neobacillus sp.]